MSRNFQLSPRLTWFLVNFNGSLPQLLEIADCHCTFLEKNQQLFPVFLSNFHEYTLIHTKNE